jgi:hypothetical protein
MYHLVYLYREAHEPHGTSWMVLQRAEQWKMRMEKEWSLV